MRFGTYTLKVTFFLCLVLFYAVGCGSDEPPVRGNQIIGNSDVGNDAQNFENSGESDIEDANKEVPDLCKDVECGEDEVCVEGTCDTLTDEGYECATPFELGELKKGARKIQVDELLGQPNQLSTQCAVDDQSPEAVFSFTVQEPSQIKIRFPDSEFALVAELREGLCRSEEGAQWCVGLEGEDFIAEPDTAYFLVVEARSGWNVGNFTVEFDVEPYDPVCLPAGSWRCDGDTRVQCYASIEERQYDCGVGGCQNNECLGDGCHNPIEVRGAMTFSGDVSAFTSRFNFKDSPSCSSSSDETGPTTAGQDMVFYLPDLIAGQTVHIRALDSPTVNVLALLEDCNETSPVCIAGDDETMEMEWEVTKDGGFYVVIDQFHSTSGGFNYSIDIRD